jgi:large subunit ribosomal protein L13Ae
MFEKEVIIDGRGHLMGRLASVVAKHILNGQRIVVVRTESINISGSLFRNKLALQEMRGHRINTNPRRGFKHWKAPSRMFWKSIRGMLPHKTPKGAAALGRLKVFEGIPFPYDHKKRVVVPEALKVLRLKSYRKFCSLGDLAALTGWTKQGLVAKLEEGRKVKSEKFHVLKTKKSAVRAKAMGDKKVATFNTELKKYGF